MYSGDADGKYVVKTKPRATQDIKLSHSPLKYVFADFEGLPLLQQLSQRICVSAEPLSKPYSEVHCVCEAIKKPSKAQKCQSCKWLYHPGCVGLEKVVKAKWTCGFCAAAKARGDELQWDIHRMIRRRGKRKKGAPTHEDVTFRRSRSDHKAGPKGVTRYAGPTSWEAEKALVAERAQENRKKTKQYKDSADGKAKELLGAGAAHHTLDKMSKDGAGLELAKMDDNQVEILLEEELEEE